MEMYALGFMVIAFYVSLFALRHGFGGTGTMAPDAGATVKTPKKSKRIGQAVDMVKADEQKTSSIITALAAAAFTAARKYRDCAAWTALERGETYLDAAVKVYKAVAEAVRRGVNWADFKRTGSMMGKSKGSGLAAFVKSQRLQYETAKQQRAVGELVVKGKLDLTAIPDEKTLLRNLPRLWNYKGGREADGTASAGLRALVSEIRVGTVKTDTTSINKAARAHGIKVPKTVAPSRGECKGCASAHKLIADLVEHYKVKVGDFCAARAWPVDDVNRILDAVTNGKATATAKAETK